MSLQLVHVTPSEWQSVLPVVMNTKQHMSCNSLSEVLLVLVLQLITRLVYKKRRWAQAAASSAHALFSFANRDWSLLMCAVCVCVCVRAHCGDLQNPAAAPGEHGSATAGGRMRVGICSIHNRWHPHQDSGLSSQQVCSISAAGFRSSSCSAAAAGWISSC